MNSLNMVMRCIAIDRSAVSAAAKPALLLTILILLLAPLAAAAHSVFSPREVAKLSEKVGPAIVRFSFVFEVDRGGNVERVDGEVSAAVVGPRGLLLVADALVSPQSQMRSAAGASMPLNFRVQSQAFRVRIAGRDLDASLIARDAELGLAWLRIEQPPADLAYIDLDYRSKPQAGSLYLSPVRSSSDFGETLLVAWGSVLGETDTPSRAYLVSGPFDLAFDGKGRVLGFVPRDFSPTADMRNAQRYGGVAPQRLIDAERLRQATAQALLQEIEQAEQQSTDGGSSAPAPGKP